MKGTAGISIFVKDGHMRVFHFETQALLHERQITGDEWFNELWGWIRK